MMRYIIIALFGLTTLSSCNGSESDEMFTTTESEVTTISVSCAQRKVALGIDAVDDNEQEYQIADSIITDGFTDSSILFFSQLGPSQDPNFNDPENIYQYKYNSNDTAKWDKYYNFVNDNDGIVFDWNKVKEIGSVGNSFSMYAFYFPVDNEVRFRVESDQRGKPDKYDQSNFKRSDIMGAYHATSSLFSRLRFKLYHLMVYLRVTLYVPKYQVKIDDSQQSSYSGFKSGAVQGAFVMNAGTDFTIEWRANRSSEEAPLAQVSKNTHKQNIVMYQHESNEAYFIEDFDVKEYYTGNVITDKDTVRVYDFSVLFPAQIFEGNFLCFVLKDVDGSTKYYYFSGSQIVGSTGELGLTQGTLQHLYLYLPRTNNETILVGANILPWSNSQTDMTVTQQAKKDAE